MESKLIAVPLWMVPKVEAYITARYKDRDREERKQAAQEVKQANDKILAQKKEAEFEANLDAFKNELTIMVQNCIIASIKPQEALELNTIDEYLIASLFLANHEDVKENQQQFMLSIHQYGKKEKYLSLKQQRCIYVSLCALVTRLIKSGE